MRTPEEMYTIHHDVTFVQRPVLVYAFTGFVDAGSAVRLAAEQILATHEHRLIASFDVDEVLDYRARRPRMRFVIDHFANVDIPQITLHEVTDAGGTPFLLLAGPEPDYQWQRFVAAVGSLVERFGASLVIGMSAVPWPAPHTRPVGVMRHGTERGLLQGKAAFAQEIEVPGHVTAMLELGLAERGIASMGLTAQVPHYLVQLDYPASAAALITGLADVTGLDLPVADLQPASERAEREIANQLDGNEEFASVVADLEAQYDQQSAAPSDGSGGFADLAPDGKVPTADEIAAQFEEFLQGLGNDEDKGERG